MYSFKLLFYSLLVVWISAVGLSANAEQVADPEMTDSAIAITEQWFKEQQSLIDELQAALEPTRVALQAEEQAFPKNVEGLITIEEVTPEMLEEAAQKQQTANQQVEKRRGERQTVQDSLDKKTATLTKLQTSFEELTQFSRAELTVAHNQQISKVEKDIALHKQAIELEQQYLERLKAQSEVIIKQAILALDWYGQLKNEEQTRLLKKQEQIVVDAQTAFKQHGETLQADQKDLPNKITALETAEYTVDVLKEMVEKALLVKQSTSVEVKNIDLEHQSAETNLESLSKYITELEKKLEYLRKTPPVEPEQQPLHDKRIAVFENDLKLQQEMFEIKEQSLDIFKQRSEQANKRLGLATEWFEKLQAVYRVQQKQALEKQIQQEQQRYLDLAAELRQKLELIPALSENLAQRYLLEVQIQEADELAQRAMRQSKTSYVNKQLEQWQKTADEQKETTEVFQSQLENINAITNELDSLLQDIQVLQTLLESKISILGEQQAVAKEHAANLSGKQAQDYNQALKLLSKLKASLQGELNKIPPLLKKGDKLLELLGEVYTTNTYRALLRQRNLPSSISEWQSLFVEISTVPGLFVQQLQLAGRGFKQAFEQTNKQRLLIIGIATLIWLSFVIFLSTLYTWITRVKERSRFLEQATLWLHLWRLNAISIAITGIFLLLIWLAQPNQQSTTVALIFLLAWLITKLLVNLSGLLLAPKIKLKLSGFTLSLPANKSKEIMTTLHRKIRWIVIGLGILIAAITFIHLEPEGKLSSRLLDLVDSIFMVLLALAIPLFMRVRRLIITNVSGYWRLITNIITLVLPGIILVVSILGITGYVVLGSTIAKYLSLFLLVLSGWLIATGLLSVLMTLWKNSALQRGESGSLWAEDLIPLIQNLLRLVLLGLAVIMFFWLTGWYENVAIKESIVQVFNFPLVTFDNGNQLKLIDIILAVLVVWIVFWLAGWSRGISYRWFFLNIADVGIRHSLSVFIQYIVLFIGFLIVFKIIGIDPTALSVFAGAMGVGIGFGMRDVVNNFISGILLLVERPLRVGNFVTIGSLKGTVKRIGIRSLVLEGEDDQKIIVPNSKVISGSFTNSGEFLEEDAEGLIEKTTIKIGVSYHSDPHLVEDVIKGILETMPNILSDPAPQVHLLEFADLKMNFAISYFVDSKCVETSEVKSKMLFSIWDRFKVAGIRLKIPEMSQALPLK